MNKMIRFTAFIIAASMTTGATLINTATDSAAAAQPAGVDPYTAFEYGLILDASELEWFDCSWVELRCR